MISQPPPYCFFLQKIHKLMMVQTRIFECSVQTLPEFFVSKTSILVHSMVVQGLRSTGKPTYEDIVMDIAEAHSFLFSAWVCRFVLELLRCLGFRENINEMGGWGPMEIIVSTFYEINLCKVS